MVSRRAIITGFFAALTAGRAKGDDLFLPPAGVSERVDLYVPGTPAPGVVGPPGLLEAIDRMHGVAEGDGRPRLRILFEFDCPRSPELHERTLKMRSAATYRWVPVPPLHAGKTAPATALFSEKADGRTLARVFRGEPSKGGDAAAATRQAQFFLANINPMLFRATGLPFATPTMVYRGRDGETRIIRGSPNIGVLRAIVASAA